MNENSLYGGLIRLHILHHAAEEAVYGLWVIEELARHGYRLPAGTLYPILHQMKRAGYLKSVIKGSGRSRRKLYRATTTGRKTLKDARKKVRELFGELLR